MSSGRYCLIRDLGPVKGGKGLRHHEVLIAFSVRAVLQRIRQVDFSLRRLTPAPAAQSSPTDSAEEASSRKSAIARESSQSFMGAAGARSAP